MAEAYNMRSLDDVFELLSRERRRYALYYLERADGPVSIEELSAHIAEWESSPPDDVPDELRDVVIELEHAHLPKVNDARFIEYDHEEGEVEITGTSPEFSVLLSVARAIEQPSREHDIEHVEDLP